MVIPLGVAHSYANRPKTVVFVWFEQKNKKTWVNTNHHLEYFWVISTLPVILALPCESPVAEHALVVANGPFVCTGCHSVWSGWRSALKTQNLSAPTWYWFSHSWIWRKPVFLLTTYMLWWPHETSSSILTNKLPWFSVVFGSVRRWVWIIGRISSQLMA